MVQSWKTYLTDDVKGLDEQTFMAADNDGNIWFDTGNGLFCFDGKNWKIVNPDIVNVLLLCKMRKAIYGAGREERFIFMTEPPGIRSLCLSECLVRLIP